MKKGFKKVVITCKVDYQVVAWIKAVIMNFVELGNEMQGKKWCGYWNGMNYDSCEMYINPSSLQDLETSADKFKCNLSHNIKKH